MVWAPLLQSNQLDSITQTILVSSWSELVELSTTGLAIKVELNQAASFEQANISGSYRGSLTIDGVSTELSPTATSTAGMPGSSYLFSGAGVHDYGPVVSSFGVPTGGYANYGSFFSTILNTLHANISSSLINTGTAPLTVEELGEAILNKEIFATIKLSPNSITLRGFNENSNLNYYASNNSSSTARLPAGSKTFNPDELSIELTDAFFDDWVSYLEATSDSINPTFAYAHSGTTPSAYALDFSNTTDTDSALQQLESVLDGINLHVGIDESMLASGNIQVTLKMELANGNYLYQNLYGYRWDDDNIAGSSFSLGPINYNVDPTAPAATMGGGGNTSLEEFFRTSGTWVVDSIKLSDFGPVDENFEFSETPAGSTNSTWQAFSQPENLFTLTVTGAALPSTEALNDRSANPLFNFIDKSGYDLFNGSAYQAFGGLAAGSNSRAVIYYESIEKDSQNKPLITSTIWLDPINGVRVDKPIVRSSFDPSTNPQITLRLKELKGWIVDYYDRPSSRSVLKTFEVQNYNSDNTVDGIYVFDSVAGHLDATRTYWNDLPYVNDGKRIDLTDIFAVAQGSSISQAFEAISSVTFDTKNLSLDPNTAIIATDWSRIIPPTDLWDSHRPESDNSPAISFSYGLEQNGVAQDLRQLAVTGDSVDESEIYNLNIYADSIDDSYGLNSISLRIKYDAALFDNIKASDITISEKLPVLNSVKIDSESGYIYLDAGADTLNKVVGREGSRTLLASISLNFNEEYLNSVNINDDGSYSFNPLGFEIIANQDETTLTQNFDDGTGFSNTDTFTLRELYGAYNSFGTDVTLYNAFINLEEIEGMHLGTQRVIGSDAGFTNLIRSGDTITATSKWLNVGNIRAEDLQAFGTETNANGILVDYEFSKVSINSGEFVNGTYEDNTRESTFLTASIHVLGTAGNVLNIATDGILYINAQGSGDFSNTLGSKNLITFTGDLNYDGRVSMKDLAYLNAGAGRQQRDSEGNVIAESVARDVDANFDGEINLADLAMLDADWGKSLHMGIDQSFLGSGTGNHQISWEQLDSQGGSFLWNNTVFKDQNALEASPSFIGSLESPVSTGVIGADGNSFPYDNDISGGFFQDRGLS